jgi:hypothetical protein
MKMKKLKKAIQYQNHLVCFKIKKFFAKEINQTKLLIENEILK